MPVVGATAYARRVASSQPVDTHHRARRAASKAAGVGIFIAGLLFDFCAVINVPGAALLTGSANSRVSLTDPGTVIVFAVIIGWISVFWRHSRPVIAWVAGAILALIGVSYLLLMIATVACLRRHPARTVAISVASAALVVLFAVRETVSAWGAALPFILTSDTLAQYQPAWLFAPFICALGAGGICIAVVLAERTRARAASSDARASEQQQRADDLAERVVRQAERDRIARDMHDALAHRLSVVSLHAGALEAAAAPGDRSGEMARTVREQTHAALQDMRGLIGDLRSGPGAAPSSPATMRGLGALLSDSRAGGVPVRAYVFIETPERASAQFDSAVFRIVQEALTNAIRNAPGVEVDVFIQVDPNGGARIRIVNPLRGVRAAPVPGGGNGILGIRERVAALHGTAWIGPHEGSFIVDVTMPWQERAEAPR